MEVGCREEGVRAGAAECVVEVVVVPLYRTAYTEDTHTAVHQQRMCWHHLQQNNSTNDKQQTVWVKVVKFLAYTLM